MRFLKSGSNYWLLLFEYGDFIFLIVIKIKLNINLNLIFLLLSGKKNYALKISLKNQSLYNLLDINP